MTSTFGDSPEIQVYVSLCLIGTIISTIVSIICVLMIYRMKTVTGHLALILYMSYFQTIFDAIFFTSDIDVGNYYVTVFSFFTAVVSGLPTAIISNWMVFAAWYIVYYKKHFDVFGNIHWILWSSCLPGLANGIYYLACSFPSEDEECVYIALAYIYDNLRIVSIGINFIFILIIIYQLNLFKCNISREEQPNQSTELELAIRTVVMRLVFYPIVQSFSRVGFTWYDLQYGTYDQSDNITTEKFICLIFYSLCSPAASVAFLVILLLTQPKAYDYFKALFTCRLEEESQKIETPQQLEVRSNSSAEVRSGNTSSIGISASKTSKNSLHSNHSHSHKQSIHVTSQRITVRPSTMHDRDTDITRSSSFFVSFRDTRTNEELYHMIESELFTTSNNMFTSEIELRYNSDSGTDSMIENPILQ